MIQRFKIIKNKPLAPLSTFGIGGKAEYFVAVKNTSELKEAFGWARDKEISWKFFSGGSNIVFPDGLLKGLLIKIEIGKDEIKETGENAITCGSAVVLQEAVDFANRHGLAGLETLAGIPGTTGGAIVGNAGAYGRSISEVVKRVEIWDKENRKWLKNSECRFAYRESVFKHEPFIVLGAELEFGKEDVSVLQNRSREIIKIRLKKYGLDPKCPGSFFKNIPIQDISSGTLKKIEGVKITENQIPAGYLLELVGARGMKRGDIQIADFHGNFFINTGRGTARDVKELAKELKKRVRDRFGIKLEEEVRYF